MTPGRTARPPAPRSATARAAALLALLAATATPALAHGPPIELAVWGDFPRDVARCQRVIGRAAAACGLRVWRTRRDCALAPLRGAACDQAATDGAADQARRAALDDVSRHCTERQLGLLQFLGLFEAQADVIRFCREAEAAVSSLLLEPLAAPPAADAGCAAATAAAATRLFAATFGSRLRVLDRIALSALPARDKLALVARSDADLDAAVTRLATDLDAACDATAFAARHGAAPAAVLALLASRADCLAGDAYAQGRLVCPPPWCGNRMREGLEECDDGDADDGDGCTADCRRVPVTSDSRS